MRKSTPWRLVFSLILVLFLAPGLAACTAQGEGPGAYSGTLVLEGEHVYRSGMTLPGVLLVLDGQVELEPEALVAGPVFMTGGMLVVGGNVSGDISAIGGRLVLEPGAQIEGNVRVGNGALDQSPQAVVRGEVLTGAASGLELGQIFPRRSAREQWIRLLPEAILLALAAGVTGRFMPVPVDRVRRAAVHHPFVSAAMGLLAGVVGLCLFVVIAFTLILIPVTLLGFALGFLAIGYGWIGLGVEVGRWLQGRFKWSLSLGRAAFAGAFVFMLALNLLSLLPFIGSLVGIAGASVALGAVVLTRFGLREFVPAFTDLWGDDTEEAEPVEKRVSLGTDR